MTSTTPSREDEHYLKSIRHRLETLYALSANDPRLREQLSDEVDWINARLAAKPADDVREAVKGDPGIIASSLVVAWNSYVRTFGEPPHGTERQMRALLRLIPAAPSKAKP